MDDCVIVINAGSSSIKFALHQTVEPLERRLLGKVDRIGLPGTNLTFSDATGNQRDSRSIAASDHKSAAISRELLSVFSFTAATIASIPSLISPTCGCTSLIRSCSSLDNVSMRLPCA